MGHLRLKGHEIVVCENNCEILHEYSDLKMTGEEIS